MAQSRVLLKKSTTLPLLLLKDYVPLRSKRAMISLKKCAAFACEKVKGFEGKGKKSCKSPSAGLETAILGSEVRHYTYVVTESLHIKCVPQSGTYLLWCNFLKADKIFPHVVRKNPYPFRP